MYKTKKELELAGTYREDRHKNRGITLKGEILTEVKPLWNWHKKVKEQFDFITRNLITYELLMYQDIPSLYQIGDMLNEIQYIEERIKEAKRDENIDRVIKLQTQKIKIVKAYNELAKSYYITPDARNKAIQELAKHRDNRKVNKALDLITNGDL